MAQLCRESMSSLGWESFILLDSKEWDELPEGCLFGDYALVGRKTFGSHAALGIANAIAKYGEGADIVMKTDCDVRISEEFSDWLKAGKSYRSCSYVRKSPTLWGGCWASPYQRFLLAYEALKTMPLSRSPETSLFYRAFMNSGGCDFDKKYILKEWLEGDFEHINTLPICRNHDRSVGIRMFAK